jgi:uncharacterized protein (PEP-CTERM system associated)
MATGMAMISSHRSVSRVWSDDVLFCARAVTGAACAMATQLAFAQPAPNVVRPPSAPSAATPAPNFRLIPEIGIGATYTDNVELSPTAPANSWITALTPSLRVLRNGPRLDFSLDYRLQARTYTSASRLNETQNFLNSNLSLEAIDRFLFVNARASITQENRSAFAAASSSDSASSNANRVETRTYQLSPYVRGNFGAAAAYQLQFNGTQTETELATFPLTRTIEWVGRVRNAAAAKVGWRVDGSSVTIRNQIIGERVDSRASGTAIFAIDPQVNVSLIAGAEQTDFATPDKRTKATYGGGLEYSPSPRTQFVAIYEKRFFGTAQNLLATHRTPRTAWRVSSIKDVTLLPNQLAGTPASSTSLLLNDLLVASIPDPAARQEAVRRRFEDTGSTSAGESIGGFLVERPFVNRVDSASATILGIRNTIAADISRTERRSLDGGPVSLASAGASRDIKQDRANIAWTYRLTPFSSMTLTVSELRSRGMGSLEPSTKEQFESLFFTTRLGQRAFASLGARHRKFSGIAATAYSENAFVASFNYRF